MEPSRSRWGDLTNRLLLFLSIWLVAMVIFTVYLVQVITPLSAQAMDAFLNSSLTVTVGLLVGVFFVGAMSAGHLPPPAIGRSWEDHRRRWAYSFLLELAVLTLGLFSTVAGILRAIDSVTALGELLLTWAAGVVALGSGLWRIVSAPSGAS